MEKKSWMSRPTVIFAALSGVALLGTVLAFILSSKQADSSPTNHSIFLYGEHHANPNLLKKELQLWDNYYHKYNMRDLFVELPYYTAEYLNLWMQDQDDTILEQLYQDWEGTAIHHPFVLDFYRAIKTHYPETILHGTDVGHQYETTGARYLEYLQSCNRQDRIEYQLTLEAIQQGQHYYETMDTAYREQAMTDNFIRTFDSLHGSSVMGIYGSAHVDVKGMDYGTGSVPCLANQLNQHYPGMVYIEDLTFLPLEEMVPEMISIHGEEYPGLYLGRQDLTGFDLGYQYREFWRVEQAYEDMRSYPVTGNVLPYHNYPIKVETGQVFVVDYTALDGTVSREYYRSDGDSWNGSPTTVEFSPPT